MSRPAQRQCITRIGSSSRRLLQRTPESRESPLRTHSYCERLQSVVPDGVRVILVCGLHGTNVKADLILEQQPSATIPQRSGYVLFHALLCASRMSTRLGASSFYISLQKGPSPIFLLGVLGALARNHSSQSVDNPRNA